MGHASVLLLGLAGILLYSDSLAETDPRYVGCYGDKWGHRALSHRIYPNPGDIEPCIRRCIEHGDAIAGLQFFEECWCGGNTYDRHGEAAGRCTTPCSNNTALMCGGDNALSVYRAECQAGLWKHSPACSAECGHCLAKKCNLTTGQCEPAQCEEGWKPPMCRECSPGKFGLDCESDCHCAGGAPCEVINGSCQEGICAFGWTGNNCSLISVDKQPRPSHVWAIAGFSIMTLIAATVIPTLMIYIYCKGVDKTRRESKIAMGNVRTEPSTTLPVPQQNAAKTMNTASLEMSSCSKSTPTEDETAYDDVGIFRHNSPGQEINMPPAVAEEIRIYENVHGGDDEGIQSTGIYETLSGVDPPPPDNTYTTLAM